MLKTHFCEELSLAQDMQSNKKKVILEHSPPKKTMVREHNTKIQKRCNIQYFTFILSHSSEGKLSRRVEI